MGLKTIFGIEIRIYVVLLIKPVILVLNFTTFKNIVHSKRLRLGHILPTRPRARRARANHAHIGKNSIYPGIKFLFNDLATFGDIKNECVVPIVF